MNNRKSIFGILLASIALGGCDGGKEPETATSSAAPQGQQQQYANKPHPTILSKTEQIEMVKARLFDDPENPALLAALGDSYFEAQQFAEAIPVYEKVLEITPEDTDTLNDLGLSYFYTGNADKALSTLAKATTAAPNYKFAWLSTGYILTSVGRYEEAIAPLNKAKELDPNGRIGQEADNFLMKIQQFKAEANKPG